MYDWAEAGECPAAKARARNSSPGRILRVPWRCPFVMVALIRCLIMAQTISKIGRPVNSWCPVLENTARARTSSVPKLTEKLEVSGGLDLAARVARARARLAAMDGGEE
jgi:hypothetical protein